MFELQFMQQFLDAGPEYIALYARYFTAVCRYQDDKWCADDFLMKRATYYDTYWGPYVTCSSPVPTAEMVVGPAWHALASDQCIGV